MEPKNLNHLNQPLYTEGNRLTSSIPSNQLVEAG